MDCSTHTRKKCCSSCCIFNSHTRLSIKFPQLPHLCQNLRNCGISLPGTMVNVHTSRLAHKKIGIIVNKHCRWPPVARFSPPPSLSSREKEVENEPPHNEPRERGNFAFCLDHLLLILITLYVWIPHFN